MKILILKLGSSILLTQRKRFDEFRIGHIADQLKMIRERGYYTILVVSGAVACGSNYIEIINKNDKILRQLAAGIGQAYLTSLFHQIFSKKNLKIAQVLLTKEILQSKEKIGQLSKLLKNYLKLRIIPVINENDVIDLNSFGGNDHLAGKIALIVNAKQLLILSTMEGSSFGVGGGKTKEEVLTVLNKKNIKTDIINGKDKNCILYHVL